MQLNELKQIDQPFEESGEGGQALRCGWDASDEIKESVIRILIEDAKRHLPSGAVFEIRAQREPCKPGEARSWGHKIYDEDDHRKAVREWGIAWYYAPIRKGGGYQTLQITESLGTSGELFQHPIGQAPYDKAQGVFLIARIRA